MESVRWAFNYANWIPTKEQWILAARCIQNEEKERIGRLVYAKDAKAAMAGRLLIRKLMIDLLRIPNDVLKLGRTDHEKPYLVNDAPGEFSFNVSHQGSYSILGAEPGRPIGVDVMKIEYSGGKTVPEFFRAMTKQFSEKEWKTILSGADEKEQLHLFYRHWCLKESYVKALGVGITFSLQRLSFVLETKYLKTSAVTRGTKLYVDNSLATNWTFHETMLDDEHCVAVALGPTQSSRDSVGSCGNIKEAFDTLTFDDLVTNIDPIADADEAYWTAFQKKS